MSVELVNAHYSSLPLDRGELESFLSTIDAVLGTQTTSADLCVNICDEAESAELNATYRNKPSATNVLSFGAEVELPELDILGDLAICWPVVQQEAATQNKAEKHHLTHLFVHGVLHLLGYDHEEEAQATEMEGLEVQVLQRLGVADPYK